MENHKFYIQTNTNTTLYDILCSYFIFLRFKSINMDRFIGFLDKTEGKDKILKFLQYLGRFLEAILSDKYSINFISFSYAIRHSRQVFRIGKSVLELNSIRKMIKKVYLDNFSRVFDILKSASMCTRWFFDNLSVLSAYKIISLDHRECTKAATTAWVFALLFNLTNCSREMMKSYAREAMLKEACIGKTTKWVVENLDELSQTRRKMILKIAKLIGDLIIASNGALIPYKILGKQFSEKWLGIGGMGSAVISIYKISQKC